MQYLRNIPDFSEMLQFPKFFSTHLDKITCMTALCSVWLPLVSWWKGSCFGELKMPWNCLHILGCASSISSILHAGWVEQKSYFCDAAARCLQYFKLLQMKEVIYTLSIIKDDFSTFYFLLLAASLFLLFKWK